MTKRCIALLAVVCCAPLVAGCIFDDGCPDGTPAAVQKVATDLDRDGSEPSSDCDDEDPTRHPAARDIPDDGIDQDCDGSDATAHDVTAACQYPRPAFFGANPGDTARSSAMVAPSCGAAATSSVVHVLASEVPARVTLQVESDTPHTLHVRAACTAPTERGCVEAGGGPLTLDFPPDVPVHVVVTATAEPGPFVLHASRISLVP